MPNAEEKKKVSKKRSAASYIDKVLKKVAPPKPVRKRQPVTRRKNAKDTADVHRRIQEKAYELYMQRGCVHGSHVEDWLEAERIVLTEETTNR